ncbi:MAG TPA: hypothetical protein VGZ02_07785 [Candidatus Baltobacteraceae bacterium]|jgi:hypothetical protein|nr:hypothetical protein [Candidatus Baltobacteraceae bacterium]
MKQLRRLYLVAISLAAGGCSTNGLSQVPATTQVPVTNVSKLQFAVGTAYFAATNSVGLNTVATFRQVNGLSASLVNTPTITGPSNFVVPSPNPQMTPWSGNQSAPGEGVNSGMGPGSDAGTNHISALQQSFAPAIGDTFNMSGGVFSSGFGPFNSDSSGTAYMPGVPDNMGPKWPTYPLPFYSPYWNYSTSNPSGDANFFLLGPPSVPYFKDGSFPGGFAGYPAGFTPFAAVPVSGKYQLQVLVAAGNASSSTFQASATLSNLNPLPALSTPVFNEDGKGGGTFTVTVPADSRIVETLLFVRDQNSSLYFAIGPLKGSGTLSFVLPDMLGNCALQTLGCENGPNAGPTLSSGDSITAQAVTFDYAQFEAEPPTSTQQTPAITGASGQADISISPELMQMY